MRITVKEYLEAQGKEGIVIKEGEDYLFCSNPKEMIIGGRFKNNKNKPQRML